jgi:Amt family ammonium transporter
MHLATPTALAALTINSGNTAFVLLGAALVCLMTPGLAFFYGGLVRRKNVLAIMMQSFISMGVVTIIWVSVGFSLAFGGTDPVTHKQWALNGIIGNFDYVFLHHVGTSPNPLYDPTIPFLAFFAFQEMFAIITPALITGAFADRVSFKSYLLFLVGWSLLIYIPFAHWVWGGGFLMQWGLRDFAGGIVVHLSAGFAALASVFVVGKRVLRPGEKLEPHNIAFVALGTGLLWFGWFGFNAGSAGAANGQAATAFVNTDIAASFGMLTWLFLAWYREKKPGMTGAMVGAVAGLACVTPAAGYIDPWAAAVVGFSAGVVCYGACILRAKMNWDDALDVWGCHGVGGALGIVLTGVFSISASAGLAGAGLAYGSAHLFGVQVAGTAITIAYSFGVTWLILKFVNIFVPVRVSVEEELLGLDEVEHGEIAYAI